jgi:predicted GNAT family N-acyltransferase
MSEIYLDAVRIRHVVFVQEQRVPLSEEIDDKEALCIHFVCYLDDKTPVGTVRLLPVNDEKMMLQRMAVLKEYRSQNYGRELVLAAENFAKEHGFKEIELHAQLTAKPFYEKLGYQEFGDEFLDAGIRHVAMKKELYK